MGEALSPYACAAGSLLLLCYQQCKFVCWWCCPADDFSWLLGIGIHLGEVLSPKHVAGSHVVAVTSRIMLEVLPIIAADLLGWKEIHPSDTAGFWASRQMLLCLLGRFWCMIIAIWLWCLFKGTCSFWFRLYKGVCSLCFLFRKLVLLWFVQGNLFPLPGYVYPFILLVSSLFRKLVLLFFIYTILTFD